LFERNDLGDGGLAEGFPSFEEDLPSFHRNVGVDVPDRFSESCVEMVFDLVLSFSFEFLRY
jgi:hypothetical protein